MASHKDEVIYEFPPFIRIHKDGHAERILQSEFVPPSVDPSTGVSSKDVVINPQTGLSARLFLPKVTSAETKLPLLIYIHGGGFCIESAFSPSYHNYLNNLVAQANVVAISVEYRKPPEQYLPIAYEDSWATVQWVASQAKEEQWFENYVDFNRVFVAGDSAGANLAHNVAIRAGCQDLNVFNITGLAVIHPLFCGVEPVGSELSKTNDQRAGKLWSVICPSTTGSDDPLINPAKDPNLSRLGCKRVVVFVAEKDPLRDRGVYYYEELRKSGWDGVVELIEEQGRGHVFHLFKRASVNAAGLMKQLVSFLNKSS